MQRSERCDGHRRACPVTLLSLADTMARHGLDPRKSLGQHFLLDPAICARIAAQPGDLTGKHVLEIGPGPGGLTRALLDTGAASVTAVEIDRRAIAALGELQAAYPERLRVIQADALKLDTATLLPAPRIVVANLPYNIGSPLLVRWMQEAASFEALVLMFQQEVAERITAAPDSDGYGRLSVLAQWRCKCAMLMRLPPGAFTPPPKVHSAVVGLTPHAEAPAPALFAALEKVTAAAFGQRRKMLRGSLKSLGDADRLLEDCEIAGDRRAETLSVAEFDRLARRVLARSL
ncbi:MAG: rRNA ((1518)-N(6)/adenine(1519)-N(6))-dimethyltransferase [Rhodospirillales bacterium]|jgi:16S rRNA (adenine1518-N6/adenine1519-N6)-dimethyltransferase|nr:rRNA ((1518)-N(6)/adenine(1519)-N(6))-dimethyltransferase [Rhodospirillales bacterium]